MYDQNPGQLRKAPKLYAILRLVKMTQASPMHREKSNVPYTFKKKIDDHSRTCELCLNL